VSTSSRISIIASLGVVALLVGCASVPTRQLNEARTDVRVAEAVGAANHPHSAYHLRLAKDQIATAEKWIDDGKRREKKRAKLVLRRAESDAELATAQARAARLREREKQEWAEVQRLQHMTMPVLEPFEGDGEPGPDKSTTEHRGH